MKKIYIHFTRPHGFPSIYGMAIRIFDMCGYSHTAVEVGGIVYEADNKRTGPQPIEVFKKDNKLVYTEEVMLTETQYNLAETYLKQQATKPYGWKTIWAIVFYRMTGIITFRDYEASFICSELAIRVLWFCKYITKDKVITDKPLEYYTPLNVRKVLRSL